ncbi:hypothetical protein IFR05_015109 [Cadophora sp. M221]|nr:hypothetical protein IFR05_015109 [Cadophora sp. M221]
MRHLNHDNIVKLLESTESKNLYYIILELVPGGNIFDQILRLTYFSENLSRHVINQVTQALDYLHEECGIIHRDLKPENILFSPIPFVPKDGFTAHGRSDRKEEEGEFIPGIGSGGIGRIKVADFGFSKKMVWDRRATTPCGTADYMAPEIVQNEEYSKEVDIWALGCVLYTMLCGFHPFNYKSSQKMAEKVVCGQYSFLSPWWDNISGSAKDLVFSLLITDPAERFTIKEAQAHPWMNIDRRISSAAVRQDEANVISGD